MQGLRLARKIVYARVEVERMRESKYSKLQRKDCLSTDSRRWEMLSIGILVPPRRRTRKVV